MIRNKKVNIMIRIVAILVTFLIIMNFTQVLGTAYIAERNNTKVTSRDPSTTEQTTTQQKNYKIAIMAGHSTSEVGARSPEGDSNYPVIKEEDLTVKVADNVEKYLSKYSNIQVVQTGSTLSNRNVQDNGRLQKAIDADVDMLVGIHFNDINGTWQEDNGILMCYNQAGTAGNGQASEAGSSAESKKLGATLKSKVSSKMGLGKGKDVEKALFTIGNSSNTDFPSVIIECGYLSSKKDYEVISKEDGLKKCAEGIVDGILDYLQIENTGYGSGSSSSGSKKLKTTIKSNEDKFLGLWKNKKGIYIPYYNSDGTINNDALFDKNGRVVTYKLLRSHSKYSPVRNVLDNSDVLFEMLTYSQRTQQYEQLMRYLLYKYTGDDIYGVTDFDFSIFDIESFNTAGKKSGGNAFLLFMKAWEGASMDSEGNYVVEDDGVGIPTVGFGIALKYNVERFAARGVYGVDTWQIGDHCLNDHGVPNDIIDSVMMEEFDDYRTRMKQETASCNPPLTTQQLDALVAIAYQYGGIGNFVEAYNANGNTDALKDAAHQSGKWAYYFKQNPSIGRAEANWKLFHEGIYTDKEGNEIVGGGDFVAVAQECWQQVCDRFTNYGGTSIPPSGTTIDCSAYVSWVVYEYGYTELQGGQKSTWDWCIYNSWMNGYGWEIIDISGMSSSQILEQLQPGDIVVRDSNASYNQDGVNHMNIVAEISGSNVYCYDCGSSNNWKGKNGEPIDKTGFVLNISTPYAKIIRVSAP